MKVIQDLAALYSALLLFTGESGQVRVAILHVSGSEDVETVRSYNQVIITNYSDKVTFTTRSIVETCIYQCYARGGGPRDRVGTLIRNTNFGVKLPNPWDKISVQSSPPWGRFSLRSKHSCAFLGKGKPRNPWRSASERVLAAQKMHRNALYAG